MADERVDVSRVVSSPYVSGSDKLDEMLMSGWRAFVCVMWWHR